MKTNRCLYRISRQDALTRACSMALLFKSIFFIGALLFTPMTFSADISGIWKHEKNPCLD